MRGCENASCGLTITELSFNKEFPMNDSNFEISERMVQQIIDDLKIAIPAIVSRQKSEPERIIVKVEIVPPES